MKSFIPKFVLLVASLFFFGASFLSAQSASDEIIVIQKITHNDGTVTVKKKKLKKGESLEAYMKTLDANDSEGQHIEVNILGNISSDTEGKEETILFIRKAKDGENDGLETYKIIVEGQAEQTPKVNDFQWQNSENFFQKKWDFSLLQNCDKSPNKPFLGIYLNDQKNDGGIYVDGIVAHSAASRVGLRKGDIITAINGVKIQNEQDLSTELGNYEPEETISITYLRNGQSYDTDVTLTTKPRYTVEERNPCEVFIGVYVGGHSPEGKGVRASGIIPNTPAEAAGIRRGDVILAIDGIPVNHYTELLNERDKHEPGDRFTLDVLRDGQVVEIEAQFKECPQEKSETPNVPAPQTNIEVGNDAPENLSVFPNPTYGNLNIQFQGEAIPTTIQVTDISGKVIFTETLNQFDGEYQKQIDISQSTPGTHILTIRQGQKVLTRSVVLVARA
ncbi:MAG: PDZ domain-containing protein [Bacteroidetes bacterium]|nr:MAG: PDZ domain-containing protein [Bacteroidota bacterium]